tara:strand:- start:7710 stop:17348 length:9639 start_codon:yes stop_codon:yes gene_type:complete
MKKNLLLLVLIFVFFANGFAQYDYGIGMRFQHRPYGCPSNDINTYVGVSSGNFTVTPNKADGSVEISFLQANTGLYMLNVNLKIDGQIRFAYHDHDAARHPTITRLDVRADNSVNPPVSLMPAATGGNWPSGSGSAGSKTNSQYGTDYNYQFWESTNGTITLRHVKFTNLPNSFFSSGHTFEIAGQMRLGNNNNCWRTSNRNEVNRTTTTLYPSSFKTEISPTNVQITNRTCSSAEISWGKSGSAADANIEWEVFYNGTSSGRLSGSTSSYTIPNLGTGNTSAFVRAYYGLPGRGTYYRTGLDKSITLSPSGFSGNFNNFRSTGNCDGSINLNWDFDNNEATSFEIQRDVNPNFSAPSSLTSNGNSTVDQGTQSGQQYYYRLRAVRTCPTKTSNVVRTSYSNTLQAEGGGNPTAPTQVLVDDALTNSSAREITLRWKDNSGTEDGYRIVRSSSSGTVQIDVSANDTVYVDNGLQTCELYTYRVKAFNACATNGVQSISSDTVSLSPDVSTTFSALPNERITATDGDFGDRIDLKWNTQNRQNESWDITRTNVLDTTDKTVIASLPAGTKFYSDNTAAANTLYRYDIQGISDCAGQTVLSNTSSDQGFRLAYGTVNGQVTYGGGTAVEGVKVLASSVNGASGKSAYFNGTNSYASVKDVTQFHSTAFTLTAFIRLNYNKNGRQVLASKYDVSQNGWMVFFENGDLKVALNGTERTLTTPTSKSYATWANLAVVVNGTTVTSYWNGDSTDTQTFPASATFNNDDILIGKESSGNYFEGFIDEMRFYKNALSKTQIKRTYDVFINPSSTNLVGYWRFDEGVGSTAYDYSKVALIPNRNHATLNGTVVFSDTIPSQNQLTAGAYTNVSGSYFIPFIPFQGTGDNFTLTPTFGVHTFTPANTTIFIGGTNPNFSGIDFIDNSSFTVQGSVVFKGTPCAVEDVFVLVDGSVATKANQPISTNDSGLFSVEVPIGEHFISLQKNGHTFEIGRFPQSGVFDFQDNVVIPQPFVDSTLRIVRGRVAGGEIQANLPVGLGRGKNNIGSASIIFNATQRTCFQDTVRTDSLTGEYVIKLPPLNYEVPSFVVNSSNFRFGNNTQPNANLNLVNNIPLQTVRDSIYDSLAQVWRVDTSTFHVKRNFIRYNTPNLDVFAEDSSRFYGQQQIILDLIGGRDTIDALGLLNIGGYTIPTFTDGRRAGFKITAFEEYENRDNPSSIVIDRIPISRGTISIKNEFAQTLNNSFVVSPTDTNRFNGVYDYQFTVGPANATENLLDTNLSFTQSLEVELVTNNGTVQWLPNPNNSPLVARVLGAVPLGGTFATLGPQVVTMVLRDPPGSESFATWEQGVSQTNSVSFNVTAGAAAFTENSIKAGTAFSLSDPIGVISIDSEVSATARTGVSVESSIGAGGEFIESTTLNTSVSTGNGIEFVGADADIFIGRSMNMDFGLSNLITLVDEAQCGNPNVSCVGSAFQVSPTKRLKFARKKSMYVVPGGYGTEFFYTQRSIEEFVIPNLELLRNNYLDSAVKANGQPLYTKYITSGPDYGKSNDDPTLTAAGSTAPAQFRSLTPDHELNTAEDSAGLSYQFHGYEVTTRTYNVREVQFGRNSITGQLEVGYVTVPKTETIIEGVDSVWWYNQQIRLWVDALARNEREKVEAMSKPPMKNISISSGVNLSESETTVKDTTTTINWSANLSAQAAVEVKSEVGGSGLGASAGMKVSLSTNGNASFRTAVSNTISYTLKDSDGDDVTSIDVFKGKDGFSPSFSVRGGQTSCPYQDSTTTKYYLPGTKIDNATIPTEDPGLSVFPSNLANIPANSPGVFNLTLQNPTSFDNVYSLKVLEGTNPNGAIIKVDGLDPNRDFAIPANSSINKQLTIERGPAAIEYDSIVILLHSVCQFASGTAAFKDIYDEVSISASFLPSCTELQISAPDNQFVFNSNFNGALPITIDNYDINYSGLYKIDLQYKPSSQSAWRTLPTAWYKDSADVRAQFQAGDSSALIIPRGQSFIQYDFDFVPFIDQSYQFRAVSECRIPGNPNKVEFSEVVGGIVDRTKPSPFGTPSPADGILDPNDDIKIKFNEPIEAGSLTLQNFQLTGVTNGQALRNDKAIRFDGTNDYLEIANGLNSFEGSFTVEFWAKRNQIGLAQTILSQGSSANNTFSIGFTASDSIQLQLGNRTFTSTYVENELGKWKHYTISYDEENLTVDIVVRFGATTKSAISNNFFGNYNNSGKTFIGKSASSNANYFNGSIHELRIWTSYLSAAEIAARMGVSLSGREPSLAAYYPMNEGRGSVVVDKARMRNAQFFAEWEINPSSSSLALDGVNQYAIVDTAGTIAISNTEDFTLEFWFKTNGGRRMSMLSNGSGQELSTDINTNGWNIEMDANNRIQLWNQGLNFEAVSADFADGNWHHFALVVNRLANVTAYVDGLQQNSMAASAFNGFGAPKLAIGARFSESGTQQSIDQFFHGNLDEVRIWNSARLAESIELDRYNRLSGDEFGLLAYFPFETYSSLQGVAVLTPNYQGQSQQAYTLAVPNGANLSSQTAAIALQRPVQSVGFTWNVNNDEIVISPTDHPSNIENVTLTVSVKDVLDLQGNAMESTKSWIAFVNKNQVVWQDVEKNLSKEFNDTLTFTSKVVNSGGEVQRFSITNLPFWLTASPSSGSIAPLSTQTITFTVNQSLNIGTFSEDILLNTDFGFDEKLLVNVKVKKTAPSFAFNPALYQNSMSIIGQIRINGVVSANEDDKLIAYINNEIRGVADLQYMPTYDKYMAFLDVYSNSADSISFKIWNSAKGELHTKIVPNIYFVTNGLVGTPVSPQYFDAEDNILKPIALKQGWNWVSFPMYSRKMSQLQSFFEGLNFADGDLIKTIGNNSFAQYGTNTGWTGNLSVTGLKAESSYLLHISQADTLDFEGFAIDPDTLPINLVAGWNRIGFVSLKNLSINTALGNYNAQNGDLIKSQQQFAFYDQNLGWIGSLKTLEPTKGYLLSTTTASSFVYPRTGLLRLKDLSEVPVELPTIKGYSLNPNEFEASTSAIVSLEACETILQDSNIVLVAFNQGELRALSGPAEKINDELGYRYFITAYGHGNESYDFALLNLENMEQSKLKGNLSFQKNALVGTAKNPFSLSLAEGVDCPEIEASKPLNTSVRVYPNPFVNEVYIEIPSEMSENTKLSLIDEFGRILIQENTNGQSFIKWTLGDEGGEGLPSGVYHIRIQDGENFNIQKIIKL